MNSLFKEAFVNPESNRDLSLSYLRDNGFSAKAVIDGFCTEDIDYFDRVTGKQEDPQYILHHAKWGEEEKTEKFYSIENMMDFFNKIDYENTIIEFCGKKLFIWHEDVDYYVIFGEKRLVEKINKYDYGHSYSIDRIKKISTEEDSFYMNFYKKYNVSL